MVLKFAHIVNPLVVGPGSDLYIAQRITFESMRRAQKQAEPELEVRLFSAQFSEDSPAVPDYFERTKDLTRSVLDSREFRVKRKLPLLKDILDRLYEAADADYLVYTNVDIGLQPSFYTAVYGFVLSGYDSFVINRRTLSARYSGIEDLEAIHADPGEPHPGWDCFVFPRALYPRFVLHEICIGAGRAGLALLANLVAFSHCFAEFKHERLTFHIGDARSWRNSKFADYNAHNTAVLLRILADLEAERGAFSRESIPGSFLSRRRKFGVLYDVWSQYVILPDSISRLLNRGTG